MSDRQPDRTMQQSHQPELLRQLREKSLNMNLRIEKLTSKNRQKSELKQSLSQELKKIRGEVDVQQKKNRSLIVLLNELQQTYHNEYLDRKNEDLIDETGLSIQNSILRYLLIRKTEEIKEAEKLANFLKHTLLDKNKGKVKEFIKKSNFLESQSEMIAKLTSHINLLRNENLQCKRKWYNLQEESKNFESLNKLLSFQNERQKTEIKAMYEEYLQRINQSKMKIVTYNETQKESIINEYLVKQIAILQQKRVAIEQENKNLAYHHQNLSAEIENIQMENKELSSFFNEPNQEGMLAQKMKKRIDELRDVLLELRKKNKSTRESKLNKVLQNIKTQHNKILEANDFIELKAREQQNYGSILQQKPIADFFSKILQEKDSILMVMKQQENGMKDKIKQFETQKELLINQISNLEENLSLNNWGTKFSEASNWGAVTELPLANQNAQTYQSKWAKQTAFGGQTDFANGNFTFDSRANKTYQGYQ